MKQIALGVIGAIVGTAAGTAIFLVLLKFLGINGLMAIGLCAGFGAGFSRSTGFAVPIIAVVIGGATMILVEWWQFPFIKDESLPFFLAHLHQVANADLLMMILGAVAAFFLAWTRVPAKTASA